MNCPVARRQMSEDRDRALATADRKVLRQHVARCSACRAHERVLNESLDLLAEVAPVHPVEAIAPAVLDRIELESRGPGLALIFRPAWKARPLIVPSLVQASAVLFAVLFGVLVLGRTPATKGPGGVREAWGPSYPASGTESNPLLPTSGVSAPQARQGWPLNAGLFDHMEGEDSLFLETVVARDGRVSAVRLIGGDEKSAEPFVEALRQQRFEPGRLKGRPVAVSVYRLISRMDVRAPIT